VTRVAVMAEAAMPVAVAIAQELRTVT